MLAISRERGTVRPGAHRFQRLLWGLGFVSMAPAPVILVTGTNGKGTVCAFLEAALRGSGLRTGLYTSPHLVSVEERVRVNGVPVSASEFASACAEVEARRSELLSDASEFEIISAAAAILFHKHNVEVAVVEIGLGGLLDSTNACVPAVSVLTGVGIDHVEFLGSTLEEIARDKAFVSRRNMPFVVAPLDSQARLAVEKTVGITGARIVETSKMSSDLEEVFAGVIANSSFWTRSNASNLRVAITALGQIANQSGFVFEKKVLIDALSRTVWPGRFDVRDVDGRTVIFDGAHNAQGFCFFESQFRMSPFASVKPVVVYASLSDKPWRDIVPKLVSFASKLVVTQVQSERAVPCTALHECARGGGGVACEFAPSVKEALGIAQRIAHDAPILVLGSLALVGEAMEDLNLDPFEKLRNQKRGET